MTLSRTRVGRAIDVGRLARAIQRPGIDPRVWTSLAVVTSVVLDPDEGLFVNIMLLPDGNTETARVGTEYAGQGWGLYAPIYEGDEVLVTAPSGDPDHGLVVTRRLHSKSDKPPDLAVENPEDFILVVQPGKSVRFNTSSGGSWVVDSGGDITETAGGDISMDAGGSFEASALTTVDVSAGTGIDLSTTTGEAVLQAVAGNATLRGSIAAILDSIHVALGSAAATQPLVLGLVRQGFEQTFLTALQTFFTALNTYFSLEQAAWQALSVDPALDPMVTQPACASAAGGATAAAGASTTMQGQAGTFQGQLAGTLSAVSFTE